MTILKCISPIDGSVFAERPTQSYDEASAAIAKARAAREDWAAQPLDKRVKLVMAGVAQLNEMVDEVVPSALRGPARAAVERALRTAPRAVVIVAAAWVGHAAAGEHARVGGLQRKPELGENCAGDGGNRGTHLRLTIND